ncbi:trans-1,2-dihydrobenzene-1,2-diol dehydrogenase [Agrilus planipennis]|uniref:Trans-1,2-dihydrobenzene-1,2-diol dehydrogenase n=1 Tax=Agrilus planipennis TaxID=224129 RepID=A0A1W4WJX5_AGRPL|nr:trans-1,2-dihydrobenzene-1,2-diol dehydrogenase [Agrilus planipennis]XP_018320325.1 trans-1,2-dihydrobenzene-1,2-diol dehydrogenase [Agrilus planipennis]
MALRWGIASAGKISNDFVAATKSLPSSEHQVVAVAARSLKSAQEFAKKLDIPKAYEGYRSLGEDKDVDVVYIGTLNPQHYEVAKLMLEHGKHVLCEKPFTINEKQTRELLELSKKTKLFLMEAVWSRCNPVYDELKKQIDSGIIGEVLYVNACFGFPLDNVDRLNVKEMGGSAVLDLGVYTLQFIQYVFRGLKPIEVAITGHLNKQNVDETAVAVLKYPGGRTGVATCSSRLQLDNVAVVIGTKGTIRVPQFWTPVKLETPNKTFEFDMPKSNAQFFFGNSIGLAFEAEEVRQCIKKGLIESPKITHAETLELAQLMDMIRLKIGNVFPEDS